MSKKCEFGLKNFYALYGSSKQTMDGIYPTKISLSYYIESINVIQRFELYNMSDHPKFSEQIVDPLKYSEYRWGYLIIKKQFRRNGIVSYLMLSQIIYILRKSSKNIDIGFCLANTSNEIISDLGQNESDKIYSSILTKKQENNQYEIYYSQNRKKDIARLKQIQKEKYLVVQKLKIYLKNAIKH